MRMICVLVLAMSGSAVYAQDYDSAALEHLTGRPCNTYMHCGDADGDGSNDYVVGAIYSLAEVRAHTTTPAFASYWPTCRQARAYASWINDSQGGPVALDRPLLSSPPNPFLIPVVDVDEDWAAHNDIWSTPDGYVFATPRLYSPLTGSAPAISNAVNYARYMERVQITQDLIVEALRAIGNDSKIKFSQPTVAAIEAACGSYDLGKPLKPIKPLKPPKP